MALIKTKDIIDSIADALQYISYYHPSDFVQALNQSYQNETKLAAKDAMAQILVNSKLSALGKRPLCQDTGLVVVFAKVGMNAKFEGDKTLQEMANEATALAYAHPDNPLRASMVSPPFGVRKNTGNNTPAILHTEMVVGDGLEFFIAAKGGGSENKSKFAMLNPSEDAVEWVVNQVANLGAGWCPPGMIGVGIGGTPEKALLMAKESLMAPIDIDTLLTKKSTNQELDHDDKLRLDLYERINQLGLGAQGLGGDTTVLDVKLKTYPTHAASLPVALVPNCAANRHVHFCLNGIGVVDLLPPDLNQYPDIELDKTQSQSIDVDDLVAMKNLRIGDTVLLSGKILTARDAAHKRIQEILENGGNLADFNINLKNRFVYYVGPVDPVGNEIVGPAGPTTSGRMDKYTEMMLSNCQIAGMIGKSERNQATIDHIKNHQSIYFIAVGGAAYLISKAIKKTKIIAFPELGMEAIYEFEIKDMPVTVAVDSLGQSIHQIGGVSVQTK